MPNPAYLHLILNHFPIIGTFIVLIFFVYGIIIKNESLKKFSLYILIFISLITIAVYTSGDEAEGIVKGQDGINEEYIDEHEDFAKISYISMEITGGIALIVLILFRKKSIPGWISIILLFMILSVNIMMAYTGKLGGNISHIDIINIKE